MQKLLSMQYIQAITLLTFLVMSCFTACLPTEDDIAAPNPVPGQFAFTGEAIIGGGFNAVDSYRNNHYRLEVSAAGAVIHIDLNTEGAEGKINVLNSARTTVRSSGRGTVVGIEDLELSVAGIYYIVVATDVNTNGSYDLTVRGDEISEVTRIANIKREKNGLTWVSGGGAFEDQSYSNIQLEFTVNEDNSLIDITAESRETEIRIHLLNSARTSIRYSGYSVDPELGEIQLENAGTYYLVGATEEGAEGNFDIAVYGKSGTISDLQQISAVRHCVEGAWTQGGGSLEPDSPDNRRFDFSVSEATTIDISAMSAGTEHRFYLLNSAGTQLFYTGLSVNTSRIAYEITTPGNYTIAMNAPDNNSGTFDLCLTSRQGSVSELTPQ